jgi:hypothetical protein
MTPLFVLFTRELNDFCCLECIDAFTTVMHILCCIVLYFCIFSVLTNYEKLIIYFVLHFRSNNGKKGKDSVCTTEYEIEKE